MKTVKKFSKLFLPAWILSGLIICAGIAGVCIKGINFGIDFRPGLIEEVRIASPAVEVKYDGTATVSLEVSTTELDVIVSGTGAENETYEFPFGKYSTVQAVVEGMNSIEGVSAVVKNNGSADSYGFYLNSAASAKLSAGVPLYLYVPDTTSAVKIDDIRATVSNVSGVLVKEMGTEENRSYQIRAQIAGNESDANKSENEILQENIVQALQNKYGKENVAVVKTDFVGSSMSSSTTLKAALLAFFTILLIWLYATIRFHWDFALGAIVALFHDCLIMFTFISWFQIEFSTTTLAAVLTIFGYSINATVVILDRVRYNLKAVQTNKFNDILDTALSETLTRSIITTITTLFASISLLVFTKGSIHDFAIVLTIGLISGCYSSIFISSGFISFVRRNWEGGANANRVRPKKTTAISSSTSSVEA
jgi:preprotein translocase subunit SecF